MDPVEIRTKGLCNQTRWTSVDTTELLKVIPLVGKDLSDFRTQFHRALVLSVLSSRPGESHSLSEKDIADELKRRLGLDLFPEFLIAGALEILENEGVVTRSDSKYALRRNVTIPSTDFVAVLFKDFQEFVKARVVDYDPYLNEDYSKAFNDVFCQFVSILGASTEISAQIIESVHASENRLQLLEAAEDAIGRENASGFVDLFLEYATSNRPAFSSALLVVYQAVIAVDLLIRGKELARCVGKLGDGCRLLLDTNVMVASLCPSNPRSGLTVSTLKFAHTLGFQIVYTPRTKLEFSNLLQNANYEMSSSPFSFRIKENELVTDFLSRGSAANWFQRFVELSNFEEILNDILGARLLMGFSEPLSADEEDRILRAAFEVIVRASGKSKNAAAIGHDVITYRTVRMLRKPDAHSNFPEPLILTLDNSLIAFDELERQRLKQEFGFVMHVRTLLQAILPFWEPALSEADRGSLASGLVRNLMAPTKFTLTLEQYAKLLAQKLDLDPENAELLLKVIMLSPLKNILATALQEENTEALSNATIETLAKSKVVEEIVARDRAEERVLELQDRLRMVADKYRFAQTELDAYKKIASRPVVVMVQAGLPPGVPELLLAAVKVIKNQNPNALEEAGVSEADLQSGDLSRIRKVAAKLEEWINRSGTLVGNLQNLAPVLQLVISKIPSIG